MHVGVIPGAGGTQRLPRLLGLQRALQMILTGVPVNASQALKMKLIDAMIEDEDPKQLLNKAKEWARWAEVMPIRRTSQMKVPEDAAAAHVICHAASLSLPQHGNTGVQAALKACRASYTLPFGKGMQLEHELFVQVLLSAQGQARRHAFFAVRKAQKTLSSSVPHHPLLSETGVSTAVVGAGTMGAGIALVLLQSGFKVHLFDISPLALQRGRQTIEGIVQRMVQRKKLQPAAAKQILSRLTCTENLNDLNSSRLVVEAVVENMKIKASLFHKLDQITPADCILLSNTSTLDIDQMGTQSFGSNHTRRSKFAGWHFFSPAHVMQLVEIVVGTDTSSETVGLLQALTKRIRKIGVVVGNCDGFCGNRMVRPYSNESVLLLVGQGNTIQDIDKALLEFGMALGPFQMSDLAGNDVGYNVRRELGWVRSDDENGTRSVPDSRPSRYTELADVMVTKLGRLGQKAGKGWYDYDPTVEKGRKGLPSQDMADLIEQYKSSTSNRLSAREIIERVLYPLVNEGFKCLEENIARSPGDIDVMYLYGYGWPFWRGGPMYWANHEVRLDVLLSKLREFSQQFPNTPHYIPSKLLERCVELDVTVEEYYSEGFQTPTTRHSKL